MDQRTTGAGAAASALRLTWARVVDTRGRAHLEARWSSSTSSPATPSPVPSHAA